MQETILWCPILVSIVRFFIFKVGKPNPKTLIKCVFPWKKNVDLVVMSWIGNVCDIGILLDDWDYFFGIFVISRNFVWFWVVKIIGIVGKLVV